MKVSWSYGAGSGRRALLHAKLQPILWNVAEAANRVEVLVAASVPFKRLIRSVDDKHMDTRRFFISVQSQKVLLSQAMQQKLRSKEQSK